MVATEQELQELLRKYYAGDTTLEEERRLQHVFQELTEGAPEDRAQFLYFQQKQDQMPAPSLLLELDRLTQLPVSTRRVVHYRITWQIAAMIVMAIGIGWALSERYLNGATLKGTAHHSQFTLPDGTTIWLNEGSVLEYECDFNGARREVSLTGEGYFVVKRDASKPFIIHTSAATTEVLGTVFSLRAKPDELAIELDVTEGKVMFGAEVKKEVKAGQSAIFDGTTRQINTDQVNPNAAAWKTKTLNFENAKLRTVFRDMSRYYHVKMRVENPQLLNCRLTAYFKDAPLEVVFDVIFKSTNLTHTVEGDTYVIQGKTYCD